MGFLRVNPDFHISWSYANAYPPYASAATRVAMRVFVLVYLNRRNVYAARKHIRIDKKDAAPPAAPHVEFRLKKKDKRK